MPFLESVSVGVLNAIATPIALIPSTMPAAPVAAASSIIWFYVGFLALVAVFLALDLGVFHRHAHEVSAKEAATWSAIWATCAIAFGVFIYFAYHHHWLGLGMSVPVVGQPGVRTTVDGATAFEQYLTGYVVEWSLSVDNLFVIAVVFSYFGVPAKYQHRVLFWGILGALVMRGGMIALGAVLIQRFGWITYVFGGFLILTAIKMAFAGGDHVHPDRNILVRVVRSIWTVSSHYDGQKFFTHVTGPDGVVRRAATPLLLALMVVEFTDLVFAVDSVPAIFAITADPFLVLTSNVFAILGLRSLYFLLANMLGKFRFLKPALVLILLFVGTKMLLVHSEYKLDSLTSLLIILATLGAGIGASLVFPAKKAIDTPHP
jgi:tellurite resistance protein TerC